MKRTILKMKVFKVNKCLHTSLFKKKLLNCKLIGITSAKDKQWNYFNKAIILCTNYSLSILQLGGKNSYFRI